MDSTEPADLSPLSFGAGLALGLMLILGLPRAAAPDQISGRRESVFELRTPDGRDQHLVLEGNARHEATDPMATAPR
ncbi:hypothetical protein [Opitutus terrae]|uniref:Uncharacterized protein n=1 Tax=Opitutus terrae (strain DSM 11246 / JCM 15787 / PB90-1) TaxID=452637 RepID=B1ZSJ4_OPITP|nr:hypothetical protein [Opitutus terrae]ACB73851.1 hypothetical protein Oter_0561 [Opitutus terrae PB90-1]